MAGYYEGWWDRFIMRICDVLFAFPGILLAIAVVAVLGSGIANVIVAVAIFSIPARLRLVRGNTTVLKRQTFVESAHEYRRQRHDDFVYTYLCRERSRQLWFSLRCVSVRQLFPRRKLSFLGLGAAATPEVGSDAQ